MVKKVFEHAWNDEVKNFQEQEALLYKQKNDLEQRVSDLTDLVVNAKSETLRRAYEKQLEAKANELENIQGKPLNEIDLTVPYRTALGKATGLLKNPYFIWHKLPVQEQHGLYYFIFEEKLPFSKSEGYRTAQIPYAISLFEQFAGQNTLMVPLHNGAKTYFLKNP